MNIVTYENLMAFAAAVKTKLDEILENVQSSNVTGIKGNAETKYRSGNVNIAPENIGLGNVTNDKQIKGLSSGTTSGHVTIWGIDGYTVADSGFTIKTDVPADAIFTDTTYEDATTTTHGLMSSYDKYKLNNIANGATANTGTITGVSVNGTSIATSGEADIPMATTNSYGVTKLYADINSTSASLAATASAVKVAYDHGGVTSVNGSTGAVTLTIPTDNSQLANGAGYQTASDVMSAINSAKPESLKNPNALTISYDGTELTYDGSEAKSIEIINVDSTGY